MPQPPGYDVNTKRSYSWGSFQFQRRSSTAPKRLHCRRDDVRSWADTKANGGSGLCDLRIQHEAPFVTGSVRSCDPTVEAFGSRAAPTLELKGAPRVRPFRVYIVTGRLWHALS
ncbi:hypothetical protein NDU88_000026 [Pleurodeles waltl]|uniref:Uncharacterized protein n=1 Tax=Pleurodeles waltl TaxID=8319 RepID=A0AAV7VVB0_PLEWA|nr:hypothetical protein NDU88_000026 [Pleurodeles waltl]